MIKKLLLLIFIFTPFAYAGNTCMQAMRSAPRAVVSKAKKKEEFFRAAAYGDTAKIKKLIKKGIDVNIRNANGWTALMEASKNGHESVVILLLKNGAKVNIKNYGGGTALIWAASNGHTRIAELLLDHGARINA